VTGVSGGHSYAYDANGNMVRRTTGGQSFTLTYDAENRLVSVSGAVSASFVYDGDGRRVKATVNGVTTYYVGDHYEMSGGVAKKYYTAGGKRVALRSDGTLYWLLNDHLGSTAVTLSGTTETGEVRYKAFGATRFSSGTTPTTYRFTGQREEAALGLYYYNARWYDPALGHFLSPDTLVPEAGNALDYHRYAYTRFNPLKYTDPTGHCVFGLDTVVCAVAAAAAIGAAANAAGNVVGQFIEQYDGNRGFLENIQSTQINGQKVAIAAGWGAFGGGAAPVTGPLGFIAANAVAGAGQKVTTDVVVSGKPLDEAILNPNTLLAAGGGALAGVLGGPSPKQPVYVASNGEKILFEVGKVAEAYGGTRFARTTSSMLLNQQVQVAASSQSLLTNVAIGSLTPDMPDRCSGFLDCIGEALFGKEPTQNTVLPCTVDPRDSR